MSLSNTNSKVLDEIETGAHQANQAFVVVDSFIAAILICILMPLFVLNTLVSILRFQPIFSLTSRCDCLGRVYDCHRFTCGWFRNTALLFDIIRAKIAWYGLPSANPNSERMNNNSEELAGYKLGVVSYVELTSASGLVIDEGDSPNADLHAKSLPNYISLLSRALLAKVLYQSSRCSLAQPEQFSLFGFKINNCTMTQAIDWVTERNFTNSCKTACFVNVNSVNQSTSNSDLVNNIKRADYRFADGSGMRVAAKHCGFRIVENVNGTDMLPILCKRLEKSGQSIFLYGAASGVAQRAAHALTVDFPKLTIAGTHHGFVASSDMQSLLNKINESGADILLVALGSPYQEAWLENYAPHVKCKTALAVGGLFDFFAGEYSRAPLWLRQLGMEWVWRLIQDPKTKFKRYVIGNPVFLFRTFFTNKARRGI